MERKKKAILSDYVILIKGKNETQILKNVHTIYGEVTMNNWMWPK